MFFFKFGGWIGRILSYLTPDPDSQNHVANHIPPTSSIALGRSCGVASMVVECWKIKEKILGAYHRVAASGRKWLLEQVAASGRKGSLKQVHGSHLQPLEWPQVAAHGRFPRFQFPPSKQPLWKLFCSYSSEILSLYSETSFRGIQKLYYAY